MPITILFVIIGLFLLKMWYLIIKNKGVERLSVKHLFYGFILLFSVSLPLSALAQDVRTEKKGFVIGYTIENGDTLYVDKIAPLYVFNRPEKWRKSRQWRDYYRTVYNFKKVYPYALKAKQIINNADSTLANTKFSKKERDKYLKSYEKLLFKEFEKPLKNLSFSQGKLLLKLLDRELGQTSFYVIKNYRGGFTAGFWQGVAKLFGSDLKKPYDKFGEDKLIEELVILYQQHSFDYLYYSMFRE